MSFPDSEKIAAADATVHAETIAQSGQPQVDYDDASVAARDPKFNALSYHAEIPKTAEEAKAEKRFLLKVDLFILPLLAIMYFLASLDRGDIGSAASAGMSSHLKLTPAMLSTCASTFYVGYILFQLPGDIFLRVITPPVQLGLALMIWGGFTAALSGAESYAAVAGLRVGVGVGEAFLQAGPLYLTFWYKRNELAARSAYFFSTSAIAGVFNGIISYGILENLNGALGKPAWQWIFLIEGVISVAYGVLVFFLLPPAPENIKWGFSQAEKEIAVRRSREAFNVVHAQINVRLLVDLLKDVQTYLFIVCYCCCNVTLVSFSTFLPVILKTFGFSTIKTQALTIPVYVCAAISTVVMGILSDRMKRRGIFLMIAFGIAGVGWVMLLASQSQAISYAGTFFVGIGTYPTVILTLSWANSNFIGFTKRAGILGLVNIFGQCFSIIGTQVYSDAPKYHRGNGFALGAMVIGVIAAFGQQMFFKHKNDQKEKNRNSPEAADLRSQDIDHVGDRHPDFVYYL